MVTDMATDIVMVTEILIKSISNIHSFFSSHFFFFSMKILLRTFIS